MNESVAHPEDQEVLVARIVRTTTGQECTIFPRDASDHERMSRWITADERGYVSLDEMR